MCLLTMSLPAFEICAVHMQIAIIVSININKIKARLLIIKDSI